MQDCSKMMEFSLKGKTHSVCRLQKIVHSHDRMLILVVHNVIKCSLLQKLGMQKPTLCKGCHSKKVSRIFFVSTISQLIQHQNLSLPHIIPNKICERLFCCEQCKSPPNGTSWGLGSVPSAQQNPYNPVGNVVQVGTWH